MMFTNTCNFVSLLRETIAWRAGDHLYEAWERADAALRRGVTFEVRWTGDGWDFGRIWWRATLSEYDRCEVCAGRIHKEQLLWVGDERARVCEPCATARPWQQRMRCVVGCDRPVGANGRYCLECIVAGVPEAMAFIMARRSGPTEIVRELDVMEYESAMRPFSTRQRQIVQAMLRKPQAWHPDGRVFVGDEAIVPLFITTSGTWLVVKVERGGTRKLGDGRIVSGWNPLGFVPVTPKGETFAVGMDEAWEAAQRWAGELRRANMDDDEAWGDALSVEIVVTPDRAGLLQAVVNGEVPRRPRPTEE